MEKKSCENLPVKVSVTYYFEQTDIDLDNLLKPILDGLKRAVVDDDRQVVELWARKRTIASALLTTGQPPMVAAALISGEEFIHILVEIRGRGRDMTDEDVRETEHRLAEQVARQLVGEGYEVFVQPGPQLLPRELVGLQPDILARRGDNENLIVEVKLTPSSEGAEQVKRIAQVVKSLPGWQVRLITAPKPEPSSPWTLAEAEARNQGCGTLGGARLP